MKTKIINKCIFFSALASVMMSACNVEEEESSADSNKLTGRVMYATGEYNDDNNSQSRTSYTDDRKANYVKTAWGSGDAFSAFINGDNENTNYKFDIQEEQSGTYYSSATFKCNSFADNVTAGTDVYAIFPAVDGAVDPKQIKLNIASQTQNGNGNMDHLKRYDYMVGKATYSNDENLNFKFQNKGEGILGRLATIFRLRLELDYEISEVTKIEIKFLDHQLGVTSALEATVDLINQQFVKTETQWDDKVTLNVTNGTVDRDEFVAYVMMFPGEIGRRIIKVYAKNRSNQDVTFESDVEYIDNISMYPNLVEKTYTYNRGDFKYMNINFRTNQNYREFYYDSDYKASGNFAQYLLPEYAQVVNYLAHGAYFDDGYHPEDPSKSFSCPSTNIMCGLWLLKTAFWSDYEMQPVIDNKITPKYGRPDDYDRYFFLPAIGYYIDNNFVEPSTNSYEENSTLLWTGTTNTFLSFNHKEVSIKILNNVAGYRCIPFFGE